MAPSVSLQSRISVFEAGELGNNGRRKLNGGVELPHLSMPHKPVHILDFDSTSPTADHLHAILPIQPVHTPSRPSSPAALGRKSSLIDFSELSSPNFKPVSSNGNDSTSSSTSVSDSRPQLPLRTSPHVPSLPARRPSITSLRTTPTTTPPPLPKRHAASTTSSSLSKQPSSSLLLSPSDSHTYPPVSPRLGFQSRHIPSSSTSSFHSVSLSSDGGDTRDSLDGSYEAVSSTAATSPTASTQHDFSHDLQPTPKLPQRQWQKKAVPSSVVGSSPIPVRRPAPPPPRGLTKPLPYSPVLVASPHHRLAPVPLNACKRYDGLFDRNLPQNPRKGRAPGWRGLSVDLLTNGEKFEFGDDPLRDDRLDGTVIKQIWSCSKLSRRRLREIWWVLFRWSSHPRVDKDCRNECDPGGLGSLERKAFTKGMWLIDEELRRARQQQQDQTRTQTHTLSSKPVTYTRRVPPLTSRKPPFVLR